MEIKKFEKRRLYLSSTPVINDVKI